MPAFTVSVSNKAVVQPLYRDDLDMNFQVCQSTDRAKMALYEANLAAFELTTATRTTHCKFFRALLGEVEHFQATTRAAQAGGVKRLAQDQRALLCHLHKQHESMMQIFPDRDVYGQCVALVAQNRVFNC